MTSRTTTALASKALSASNPKGRQTLFRSALALATALTPVWAAAQDLPTGGTVVHGAATIATPNANTMIINQGSDRAVVNWDGFSVGAGNSVNINQPTADSAILNRVTGDTTSQIHGQINANGRVFVVNPNGIFIGATGSVNTGSFVASTLGIRTDDFVTGQTVFEGNGSSATVSNAGNIQVVTGGYAALIGGKVKNSGTIQAPLGFVGLGSGERVTLDLAGDGFMQVAIPTNSDDAGLEALIENSGTIQANGGTVQMSAATARNAARQAINMSGVVEARTVSGRSGRITLGGGAGGRVKVTGKVRTKTYRRPAIQVTQSARPVLPPERGGDITITGHNIEIAGADIDASGINGGGAIRIGGNMRGAAGLMTADTLSVDQGTTISADAYLNGNGGRVIAWSDLATEFAGNISVRGGDLSGNGGFAEVSGKINLSYAGFADGRAPNGETGDLLLDPTDIEIVAGAPGANQIQASALETDLATMNVTISTAAFGGTFPDAGEAGTITVESAINWGSGNTLTLDADDDIVIEGTINSTGVGGDLVLSAFSFAPGQEIVIDEAISVPNGTLFIQVGQDIGTGANIAGPVTLDTDADINVGTFDLELGNWIQNSPTLADFDADNFVIDFSDSSFMRVLGGDGAVATPYLLTDVYGLQGMTSGIGGGLNFELSNNIDASPTTGWLSPDPLANGVRDAGFVPRSFGGVLDGQGFDISQLFVRRHSQTIGLSGAGLFSSINSGTVQNLSLTGADIAGREAGIVTAQNTGTIDGVSVSGTVRAYSTNGGSAFAGGIAGSNAGTISNSIATVAVFDQLDPSDTGTAGAEFLDIGGVAGVNTVNGTIDQVRSAGNIFFSLAPVFSANTVGGLVGSSAGSISNAYSTATVSGNTSNSGFGNVGGLTGRNTGSITNALASNTVTLTLGGGTGTAGAVTGFDDPSPFGITSTYFNSDLSPLPSGQNGEVDAGPPGTFQGARGLTTAALNDADLFYLDADGAGWDFNNVWAFPQDGIDHARLYTVDLVVSGFGETPPPNFTYNGSTTGHTALGTFSGGPGIYRFAPGDTGNLNTLQSQITLSSPNAGPVEYRYPTLFTSDLPQQIPYNVRSLSWLGTVNPAPLTVTVNPTSKSEGTTLTFAGVNFSAATLFGSDAITNGTVISPGAPASAPAGTYSLSLDPLSLTGPGMSNYTVSVVPGTLTVNAVALQNLNILVSDAFKTYGEQLLFAGTEFTTAGLAPGDSVDSLSISSAGAAATAEVADGPFAINGSNPVGTGLENYSLTITPGTLTIIPAPLTITADDQTKPLGTEFTFTGTEFTVAGLLNADEVTSASLASGSAAAEAPFTEPGGDAIFITDPLGTGLDNYVITLVNGVFVVAPGNLTITALDQTKVYGSTFTFDGTEFSVVGLAEGDSVDSVTLASAGAAGTAQVAGSPFAIVASDAVGTGLDKYTLIFADGSMTVVPAPLTVTALDQTKQQGQLFTFAGTEFATSALFNDDSVTSATISSDGAATEALADDSPFAITINTVTGTGLDNYDISTTNGSMTVQNLITPPVINPVPSGNTTIINPPDAITISFPGSDGTAGLGGTQTRSGGATGGPAQTAPQTAPQAEANGEVVETVSTELEVQVQSCGAADQDFDNYMTCLSSSLDTYSNALDEIVNDLPEGLETVSATIRTASDNVKAASARAQRRLAGATTDAQRRAIRRQAVSEARGAINQAKSEIRKAISLIRADDPEVAAVQRDTGARIIQAFDTVDSSLVRAVEL